MASSVTLEKGVMFRRAAFHQEGIEKQPLWHIFDYFLAERRESETEAATNDRYETIRHALLGHEYRGKGGDYACSCGWNGASVAEHLADKVSEVLRG